MRISARGIVFVAHSSTCICICTFILIFATHLVFVFLQGVFFQYSCIRWQFTEPVLVNSNQSWFYEARSNTSSHFLSLSKGWSAILVKKKPTCSQRETYLDGEFHGPRTLVQSMKFVFILLFCTKNKEGQLLKLSCSKAK